MKKLITLIAFLSAATVAQASFHAGASVGYLIDAEEPLVSVRVGYTFAETNGYQHAVEGEIGRSTADYGIFKVTMTPTMLNYRTQKAINEKLYAYGGVGVGSVNIDVEFGSSKGSGDGFAWQVFGGLGYYLTENLSAVGGVRFIDTSDITIRRESVGSDNDTEFSLGVKFEF
jgi:opacity protein-like surface antigen